jgi:thioredoxin-like negative regulator of GroEL
MSRTNTTNLSPRRKVEISHRRAERFYVKLLLGGLIGLIVLIGTIWAAHGGYVRWQERRLVRRAVYALQHDDYRTAGLAARNVLEMKPSSAPATRIVAEIAERAGDRAALQWRRKVAELEPESAEDAMAWARCALQFNDPATAERALATVSEPSRQTAGYHAVVALLAQARGENEKATQEWSAAVQLSPNDNAYRLQLGIIQLRSAGAERHAAGEATLKELRQDPKQRAPATRALISEGTVRHQDATELLQLAHDLQSYPEATMNDRLLYLDFLHQLNHPEFSGYLTNLEKDVTQNANDLTVLLSWMSQNNLNLLAVDLLKGVPAETTQKWPVPLAIAEIYGRLGDWRKLEAATKGTNWQQFDFLRHAYLTRALRGQDKPAAAEHEWASAVKIASNQADSLVALIKVTSEWKWTTEATDLLWSMSKFPEKQAAALQTLYRLYVTNGDTQGLYRVLVRLSESGLESSDLKNNLAQVELLLNANMEEGRRLAAEVYRKAPSNPAYATTYAYSLLTQGDAKGALKVLDLLTPEQLREPSVSAYYGICLAAVHDRRAIEFLQAGEKANLLAEEKTLIKNAFARLNARAAK